MDLFEKLTGFREAGYNETRGKLKVDGRQLQSLVNGECYGIGELELVALQTLRERVRSSGDQLAYRRSIASGKPARGLLANVISELLGDVWRGLGHPPSRGGELATFCAGAHDRSRVIRKHARHRRKITDVSVHDSEQRDDGRLVGGDRVEIMPMSA
jgi:hypothetical protein